MKPSLRKLFLEHVGQTSDFPMALEVERAEGVWLYGPGGKKWIDLISGVSVSAVGHGNPAVVEAVCAQARSHLHLMVYGEVIQSPQVRYAERISALLPGGLDSVYFVNSGSEAVEGALKLAKRYTGRTELIGFQNAYHGSTQGALSVMGGEEYRASYRPLLPDVRRLRFNSFDDLVQLSERTACVIVEPVQGEGGIILPETGFLEALRKRCDEVGALLIFDEIQTGLGRTGTLFYFQQTGAVPDILCTAKAFGGGMPLGAFIAPQRIMQVLKTNPVLGHITTFGGHPVCCAAGLAALDFVLENDLMARAEERGAQYETLLGAHPAVREIRRTGLLLGVEFGESALCARVVDRAVRTGLLTEFFLFRDTALRVAPPLTISPEEVELSARMLLDAIDASI